MVYGAKNLESYSTTEVREDVTPGAGVTRLKIRYGKIAARGPRVQLQRSSHRPTFTHAAEVHGRWLGHEPA